MGVVIAHFNQLMGCNIWWPVSSGTAVSVFFGLSGFLVYATFQRKRTASSYVWSRVKRIVPVYSLVVILSALLLAFCSTLNIRDYFVQSAFWKYLAANLCYLNFLQPTLPGVFTDSPVEAVNGSLWTLKVEWFLYLSIILFAWSIKRCRISATKIIILLYVLSVVYRTAMVFMYDATGNQLFHILSYQFLGQFTFFYSGVLLYINHEFCKKRTRTLLFSSAVSSLAVCVLSEYSQHWAVNLLYDTIFPISIVSFFVLLCCVKSLNDRLRRIPNLSYEIYLVHFPVIQVIAQMQNYTVYLPYVLLAGEILIMLLISYVLQKLTSKI